MRREHARRCGSTAGRAACAHAVGGCCSASASCSRWSRFRSGTTLLQRDSVAHGVRVAGVPLGGASRAEAEREISAAVGDELQREVTVTVAGRSATLSPYDLGVRVDAPATARAALDAGKRARRPALLGRVLARDRPGAALPGQSRAAGRARRRDAVAGQRAPRAQAERRGHRRPRQARRRLRSRRGAARDHGRGARRSAARSRCARCRRRPPSRPRPRAGPRLRVAQLLSAPITFTRRGQQAASGPVRRLAPLLSATAYKHVIGVQFDPKKVGAALRPPLSDYLRPRQGRALDGRGRQRARALVAERHRSRRAHDGAPPDARGHRGRRGAHGRARLPGHAARADHRRGARARRDRRRQHGDDEPRRLVGQPRLQRRAARDAARRHHRQAGRHVLVQHRASARAPPRAASRRARRSRTACSCRPSAAASARPRRRSSTRPSTGGYEVTHRLNHSFYISHYPLGLDATVADNGPDFTFVNDTEERDRDQGQREPGHDDGVLPLAPARPARRVDDVGSPRLRASRRSASTPARTWPPATLSQTTLGERGFTVTVSRTVMGDNGKVRSEDSFTSRYIPEDAIYLVGKGGTLPAGQTLSGLYPGYTGSTDGIDLNNWLAEPKPPKKKKPAAGDDARRTARRSRRHRRQRRPARRTRPTRRRRTPRPPTPLPPG